MPPKSRTATAAANTDENTEVPGTVHVGPDESKAVNDENNPEREITGKGTFYEDFDNEEYPDAVMPSPGQMLVFEVISSNIVPIENKRTKAMEDTEVVQIKLLEGTTCTVKIKGDDGEYEDTGELEPINDDDELRSLWINSFMLRKIWETWDPQPGEVGALKFKGKQVGRSNEYQKWFGKFDKPQPRRTLAR